MPKEIRLMFTNRVALSALIGEEDFLGGPLLSRPSEPIHPAAHSEKDNWQK